MKNTTSTATSTTLETGTTEVLAPATFTLTGTAPFTVSHTFTSNFVWDGTSNLLVEFCFNNSDGGGVAGNSASLYSTNITTAYYSTYYSSDNNATVCSSPGSATRSYLRPNINLIYSALSPFTWTPQSGLYTDAGGTVPYTGGATPQVYGRPASTTTYTATATNAAGCINSGQAVVNVSTLAIGSVQVTQPTCNGVSDGSITVNASGGSGSLMYSIDNGGTWQASALFSGLGGGTYNVKIKDGLNCELAYGSNPVVLTTPPAINASAAVTVPVACFGGSATVVISASGGTAPLSYTFNGNTNATGVFTGISAGTGYAWSVDDANGCGPVSGLLNVTQPDALSLSVSVTTPVLCNGGTGAITLSGSGGVAAYEYSIDNGLTWQLSGLFSGLTAGSYSLSIKDANNCTAEYALNPFVLTQPDAIAISNVAAVSPNCNGGNDGSISVTASGGTGSLQYSIDNGSSWQLSSLFSGLASGSYNVRVKDANNCEVAYSGNPVALSNPALLSVTGVTATDPGCYNISEGSILINASGGSGTLQYSIDNGSNWQTSSSFSLLAPGSYNVKVKDANNCMATYASNPVVINNPVQLVISSAAITSPILCNGEYATITIVASGGTGSIQYSVDGLSWWPTGVFPNLGVNNWNAMVKDQNNCITVYSGNPLVVTQPPAITYAWVNSNNVTTCGASDGNITVSASGGTGSLQYSIDNGTSWQSGATFTGLGAGGYEVVVKDANNCQVPYSLNPVIISSPSAAIINSVTSTNVGCFGGNTGTIFVDVSAGTPPYTYSSNGGVSFVNNSGLFTGLTAGNYGVAVKDAIGCITNYASNPVQITQPTQITIGVSAVNNACYGGSSGSITITASGGTGTLQYSIDNGSTWQASNLFSGLTAGSYTIKVKDANNCERSFTSNPVQITQPTQIIISNVAPTHVSCNGGSNGSITVTASGGTGSLQYSINNGSTWQASNLFSGLTAGSYTIKVKDANNCEVSWISNPVVLSQPSAVEVSGVAVSHVTCNGGNNGSITVTASGGTGTLQYSIDNGTTWQSSALFNNLIAGSYTVKVKDANNCETPWASNPVVISQPSAVAISNVGITGVSCYGGNNGSISITAAGGTGALQYSIDGGTNWQSTSTFNSLSAGNYTVKVKDASGCEISWASNPAVVSQPTAIVISGVNTTDLTCNGVSTGIIIVNASGGTGALHYSINNGSTWQSGNAFVNLPAGNYTLIVKDASNCEVTYTSNPVVISQPPAIVIGSVNAVNVTCNGGNDGSIAVTASGGTGALQYSIDNGTSWQSSSSFAGLTAGSYTVKVKDANNCIVAYVSNPVIISQPPAINIASVVKVNVNCNGASNGSITITAAGGTGTLQYSIDNGNTYQTSDIFSGLAPGSYNVKVKDASNCTVAYGLNPVVISEPSAVAVTNVTVVNVSCNGGNNGSLTIAASGGTGTLQYSIDNGTNWQTPAVFTGLTAGSYTIRVKDANNCETAWTSNPVVISEPLALAITNVAGVDILCYGGNNGSITITATGGTGALQYSINNGTSWQSSNLFGTLVAGNYNIRVKDANNCEVAYASNPFVINQPAQLVISSVVKTNVNCNGGNDGSITITATGGTGSLQYTIDNGNNWQSSNVFNNLMAGVYQVRVKDASNCEIPYASNPVTITEPGILAVDNVVAGGVTCFGGSDGSLSVTASGGTGTLQYSVDNGTNWQSSSSFTGLSAGNYIVRVKDANNCEAVWLSNPAVVSQPDSFAISVSTINVTCNGADDGWIIITATGGTGTLEYSINNGVSWSMNNGFTNLTPGSYAVLVKDANGCQGTYSLNPVLITEPSVLSIDSVHTANATCHGDDDGSIEAFVSGGTQPYQYSIDGGSNWQSASVFSGLPAGNYYLVVKDTNGCELSFAGNPVVISQPAVLLITQLDSTNITTVGGSDGTITIFAAGGTPPYEYSIDGGTTWVSNGGAFTGLSVGDYLVAVRDANGCVINYVHNPVHLSDPTGVGSYNTTAGSLNVYPNPTKGLVTIELRGIREVSRIEILSFEGRLVDVLRMDMPANGDLNLDYDFTSWARGVYYLRVIQQGNVLLRKLVVN